MAYDMFGNTGFTGITDQNTPGMGNWGANYKPPVYKDPTPIQSVNTNMNGPIGGNTNTNQPFDMNALMAQISKTSPVTSTTNSTITSQHQNQSPALEKMMADFQGTINNLGQNMQNAYQNKSNTYGDLIASLTNMYGAMGSGQSNAAQTTALSSGLSPLEAQQAGGNTMQQVMQQYYPALAGTRGEQADVGINLQNALAGLQQNLTLPMMTNIAAPYDLGVAGTVGNQYSQGTQTNPLAKLSLLLQGATAQQNNQLGLAQLAQQGNQFDQTLANRQSEFGQSLNTDLQKLMAQLGMQQYGIDTGAQTSANTLAGQSDLQKYLQVLQGQQGLEQAGAYGKNALGNITAQGEQVRKNYDYANTLQQGLQHKNASGAIPYIQQLGSDYFGEMSPGVQQAYGNANSPFANVTPAVTKSWDPYQNKYVRGQFMQ